jgi:pyruvate kinase
MARYVSNMRPERAPIFAFTPHPHIYRQLAVCWGVAPIQLPFADDPNTTIEAAETYLREHGLTKANDSLIVLSDLRAGDSQIDSIQVRQARGDGSATEEPGITDEESLMD